MVSCLSFYNKDVILYCSSRNLFSHHITLQFATYLAIGKGHHVYVWNAAEDNNEVFSIRLPIERSIHSEFSILIFFYQKVLNLLHK
jgi:hypothetical protein